MRQTKRASSNKNALDQCAALSYFFRSCRSHQSHVQTIPSMFVDALAFYTHNESKLVEAIFIICASRPHLSSSIFGRSCHTANFCILEKDVTPITERQAEYIYIYIYIAFSQHKRTKINTKKIFCILRRTRYKGGSKKTVIDASSRPTCILS